MFVILDCSTKRSLFCREKSPDFRRHILTGGCQGVWQNLSKIVGRFEITREMRDKELRHSAMVKEFGRRLLLAILCSSS